MLAATLDIILSWKAWGSMKYNQILRIFLKFAIASLWLIALSVGYSGSIENPTGIEKNFSNLSGRWQTPSFYSLVIIYMIPNILAALIFVVPPLRRSLERSNWRAFIILLWWAQASFLLILDSVLPQA